MFYWKAKRKYEFTKETIAIGEGRKLYRIRAVRDFGTVKAGDLGGFVETRANLSDDGNCWIADDGVAMGRSKVYGNALLSGKAIMMDEAELFQEALATDQTILSENTKVYGNAQIREYARARGQSHILGDSVLKGHDEVSGRRTIYVAPRPHKDIRYVRPHAS